MDSREYLNMRPVQKCTDIFRSTAQSRVDTYNSSSGKDDGTGIQCEVCRNRGNIAFINEQGNFACRPCKCEGTRRTVQRLQNQGLYEMAQSKHLDNFQIDTPTRKSMKAVVERYLADQELHWLILCGQSGSGKTHLATAAFIQMCFDRGLNGRYLPWISESRKMKASGKDGDDRLINDYKKCGLLYIDDLFKTKRNEDPSDADVRLAFDILDYRYSHNLPTIVSTEKLFEELEALDTAIYRRIHERCGTYIANIGRDRGKCFIPTK